jgi:Ca2+-binding RTX toxin-like protein
MVGRIPWWAGLGNDTYQIGAASTITEAAGAGTDLVISTVSYTLAANVDNLTLDNAGGAINGTGNGDANTITGNASNNILSGAGGNDIIDGGGGADSMTGGLGNDTFYVDHSLDGVTESTGEGTDLVYSLINVHHFSDADVENLSLYGTGNVNATGNASVNALVGNSGNNRLDGLGGADTMTGGAGDDIYVVDAAGDTVVEALNEGTDEVRTTVSYTLSANVEYITLLAAGGAINGTGNALANILTGNASANVLTGGAGDDIYYVDSADSIVESIGGGTDTAIAAFRFYHCGGF